MSNKPTIRSYDKTEWQRIALVFLSDKKTSSSALESANIALRGDDPDLASKCLEEAKRRRKSQRKKDI